MISPQDFRAAQTALGAHLRAFRQAAGYSQHELARLVFTSRSSIANIETGRQSSERRFWERCDEVTRAEGALLAAHSHLRDLRQQHAREGIADTLARSVRPMSSRTWADHVSDVGLISDSLTIFDEETAQHVAAALGDARRYVDESVVDHFGRLLESYKATDGDLGPAAALPRVLVLVGAVGERAREVKPGVRSMLLSFAADGAEFAGWLYRDLHQLRWAMYWYDRAMEWAQAANDTSMQGYVLIKKSQMAYDARDAHRVATLADAAVDGPWRLTSRMRCEALLQTAIGMAMNGVATVHVERAMDEARQLLEKPLPATKPAVGAGTSFTAHTLALRQAACYTEAGKPAKAAELFGEVIATGFLSRRDVGFFSARQATALALSGEPDEASRVGLKALRLAAATNSGRTSRVVRDVMRILAPWDGRPGPRELRAALSLSQ